MLRGLALLLLLIICLPSSLAQAQPNSALRVSTVSHGIKLTLTIPGRVYPRNAVIQVRVTVKNISHHAIYIASGLQAPTADVLDSSGTGVYDPLAPLGNATLITYTLARYRAGTVARLNHPVATITYPSGNTSIFSL